MKGPSRKVCMIACFVGLSVGAVFGVFWPTHAPRAIAAYPPCTPFASQPSITYDADLDRVFISVWFDCGGGNIACEERLTYILWKQNPDFTWKSLSAICHDVQQNCNTSNNVIRYSIPELSTTYGHGHFRVTWGGYNEMGCGTCAMPVNCQSALFFYMMNFTA